MSNLKVVPIDACDNRPQDPKEFLRAFAENLEKNYPNTEHVVVLLYANHEDGDIDYVTASNNLRNRDVLWLLEQSRASVLRLARKD